MFGLPENTLSLLLQYFASRQEIEEVIVYGSRAMGTEAIGSDIDLAIITDGDQDISASVKSDLEDLKTPYLFDVTDYKRITHEPLKAHIDRVGRTLYARKR